jgi:hypothetical protein
MRALLIVAGLLVAFLIGGYVDHAYDWPFGLLDAPSATAMTARPPMPSDNTSTAIPTYSRAQGAQDAPRNDVPAGATTDLQRCINTMILRRESPQEAKTVCQKIIAGIGG